MNPDVTALHRLSTWISSEHGYRHRARVCSENGALDLKVYAATCAREWNGCGINNWSEGIATVQKIGRACKQNGKETQTK